MKFSLITCLTLWYSPVNLDFRYIFRLCWGSVWSLQDFFVLSSNWRRDLILIPYLSDVQSWKVSVAWILSSVGVLQEIIQEQITRVLFERLIVHRPHPWGLLITFIELIKVKADIEFCSPSFLRPRICDEGKTLNAGTDDRKQLVFLFDRILGTSSGAGPS